MARRKGFWAEVNRAMAAAERDARQRAAAQAREQAAAEREYQRQLREYERAKLAAERADTRERAAAEKQARAEYLEARLAEVASLNAALTATYEQIDGILAATLEVDDYVDLESLRITPEHPPFDPGPLGQPAPLPRAPVYQSAPEYQEPVAPKGLSAAFGGKKKHEQAIQSALAAHAQATQAVEQANQAVQVQYQQQVATWQAAEDKRLADLAAAEQAYQRECAQRVADAEAANAELDTLITNLAFDVESAIEEYVGIVMANSAYPEAFDVTTDYTFDLTSRELTVTAWVPAPEQVPDVREYVYVKKSDEITAKPLTIKAKKDRYASAVWQVAVRTLHEIFEADRAGRIHSIALTVATRHVDPATGQEQQVPLVLAAADRDTFAGFDLANIVPLATLQHLGAAVSKSPFDAVPADTARGVRTSKA